MPVTLTPNLAWMLLVVAGLLEIGSVGAYGISFGISTIAPAAVIAAHWAATCARNAASSAESCGLVVERLIATSK